MIEVEKDFSLKEGDKERLLTQARQVVTRQIVDVYYDADDYAVVLADRWLRNRDGHWELKIPLNTGSIEDRTTDQYREVTDETEIVRILGLHTGIPLSDSLASAGYVPFGTITTIRTSCHIGDFELDFDETEYGVNTLEIELLVERQEDIAEAERRIVHFAHEQGLTDSEDDGKVVIYIKLFQPERYRAMVARGIVSKR